jgi:glycine/D-amino acid oxidase-like deaminating enzyme
VLANADVVVVGGGAIGSSVAYYLARAGAKVAIVERNVIGSGASSANPGAVNMITKQPGPALALAQASQRLYPGLSEELGVDVEYEVTGTLIVAETEFEMEYCTGLAAQQEAAGVRVDVLGPAACHELNPLLEGPVLGGIWCPTDAHINPFKVTSGFAVAAQRLGAEIVAHTAAEGVELEGGRVTAVRTGRGTIRTKWLVNAAGAYSAQIGRMVGAVHDVVPRRGQIMVLEATPGLSNVKVSSAKQLVAKHLTKPGEKEQKLALAFGYTRKSRSGTVLLGSTNEFVGYDASNSIEVLAQMSAYGSQLMPALKQLNVMRTWAGLRPYSASGPIIGRAGGPDGYVAATGHGGDGVALSPITGTYVAAMIERDDPDLELNEFLEAERADAS